MEVDKENISKLRNQTKIPLPLPPLPPLSHNMLKRQDEVKRHPLKAINPQDFHVAGPSRKIDKVEKENIDTQYVTIRQKSEDLDWAYKVFKDGEYETEGTSTIVISDDEDTENEVNLRKIHNFVQHRRKNCLGDINKTVAPVFKSPSLQPSKIKHIKKSLKRPHSRELLGLSPVAREEKREEKHKRRLNFNESLRIKSQSPDYDMKSHMSYLNNDYTSDVFTYLINAEKKTILPTIRSHIRSCLINWFMKVNGPEGNPSTVQFAQWYFDATLAVKHIKIEKLQVVAAACFWIAQKIHGPYANAKKLVKCSSHAFSCANLVAAEKVVLITLKFPRQPIIPQEFISYLTFCCASSRPREIEEAATFLCMAGVMVDKQLCNLFPSVLAAAAVRNAVILLRDMEAMVRLQMDSVFRAAERKTPDLSYICSIQKKAVRVISSPFYEHKALLVKYSSPLFNVAQKIVAAVDEFNASDTKLTLESM